MFNLSIKVHLFAADSIYSATSMKCQPSSLSPLGGKEENTADTSDYSATSLEVFGQSVRSFNVLCKRQATPNGRHGSKFIG